MQLYNFALKLLNVFTIELHSFIKICPKSQDFTVLKWIKKTKKQIK